ncbi:MAG: DUF945 family protein, partial [Burkholderiaceae bacterium]|nr:DUF945 family protein [Burkholderiaceae bacterium]
AWGGLTLKNTFTTHLDKIKGQLNLVSLGIHKERDSIDLQDLNTQYDFRLNPVGIYVGDAQMSLKQFKMGEALQVQNFKVENKADIHSDMFSTRFNGSLESAQFNGITLGPSRMDVDMSQINAVALAKAQQSLYPQQNASPS